jgi:hypothetical protein
MRIRRYLLFTILIILTGCPFIKAQPVYFSKAYHPFNFNSNEYGTGTLEYNNAYYTIGNSYTQNAIYWYFLKTDLYGDTLFTKLVGKTWRAYYTNSNIIKSKDDNFVFCGMESLDTLNGSLDSCFALLVKIDQNGDTLWVKKYQYSTNEENLSTKCIETSDKGFMITGMSRPLNFSYTAWAIKTDSLGNIQWQNIYGAASEFFDVEQTLDSGYIFSGCFGFPNSKELYVVKTDKVGGMQWQKLLGTTNNDNQYTYVHQLADSHYIVTGAVDTSAALGYQGKGYIAKLRKNGSLVWEKTYNGPDASKLTSFKSKILEITPSEYIVIGGKHLLSDPNDALNTWLVRIDSTGQFLWERTYNYSGLYDSYSYCIVRTSDKGFILPGSTNTPNQDLWLLKLDSLGCEVVNCTLGMEEKSIFSDGLNVYPNPVNNTAVISYTVPEKCVKAEIDIYNLLGKRVATIPITKKGSSDLQFSNSLTGKGVYLFTLVVDGITVDHKKVVVTGE